MLDRNAITKFQKSFDDLIQALHSHQHWIGRTNREVRDQVESVSKQASILSEDIVSSSENITKSITFLADSINKNSRTNTILSIAMVILTLVIAISSLVNIFNS